MSCSGSRNFGDSYSMHHCQSRTRHRPHRLFIQANIKAHPYGEGFIFWLILYHTIKKLNLHNFWMLVRATYLDPANCPFRLSLEDLAVWMFSVHSGVGCLKNGLSG